MSVTPYWKFIFMALTATAMVVVSAFTDGKATTDELLQIGLAAVAAVTVYVVPNIPQFPWLKNILALLALGLSALVAVATGGITGAEMANVIVQVLGALMVVLKGNAPLTSIADHRTRA